MPKPKTAKSIPQGIVEIVQKFSSAHKERERHHADGRHSGLSMVKCRALATRPTLNGAYALRADANVTRAVLDMQDREHMLSLRYPAWAKESQPALLP